VASTRTGKLADPQWRHDRAVKAATARTSTDAHITAIEDRASELDAEQQDRVRRIADSIELSDDQLSKLAVLLDR
jgi:hypothetical protein